MRKPDSSQNSFAGLTLVEMLFVVSIALLLMALIVPPVTDQIRTNELRSSAGNFLRELRLAKHEAVTRNLPVEVRLFVQPAMDKNFAQPVEAIVAYQFFELKVHPEEDRLIPAPFSEFERLPRTVIITTNTQFSTLLDGARKGTMRGTPLGKELADLKSGQSSPDPASDRSISYYAFTITPTGRTDLATDESQYSLTFWLTKSELTGEAGSGLPPDYFTVTIDRVTASARVFRPN